MSSDVELRPPRVPTLVVGLSTAAAASGLPEYCLRGAAWCGDLPMKRTARSPGSRPYRAGAGRFLVSVADLEAWLGDLDPESPYMQRWLIETAEFKRLQQPGSSTPAALAELSGRSAGDVDELVAAARRAGASWPVIAALFGVSWRSAVTHFDGWVG